MTQGAKLVKRLEEWFAGYLSAPTEFHLVMALWAMNTWIFQVFDAVPCLGFLGSTKQCGKTVGLELEMMVSKNGQVLTDPTPATLFRMLEARQGWMTIGYDEAEKLAQEKNPMRAFFNSGYRKGQTLPRTLPGGKVEDFPVFCPKAFALIGDTYDTLRDRSIVLWLERGLPVRKYRYSDALAEASELVTEIEAWVKSLGPHMPKVDPVGLSGRDEEIWTPLISIASAIGMEPTDYRRLVRASHDLTAMKTEKAKHFNVNMDADAEDIARDVRYSERLLRDLRSVIKADEKYVYTVEAVERLRAIDAGPWRTYRGQGITPISLGAMLQRFGVRPVDKKRYRPASEGGTKQERQIVKKGYEAATLDRAIAGLGDGMVHRTGKGGA